MFSSRLFWRLFGALSAVFVPAAVLLIVLVAGRMRAIIVERVQRRLHDSAVILRNDLQSVFSKDAPKRAASDDLQRTLKRLGEQTETRITLVAENGTVIGDSSANPAEMENHGSREEVTKARQNGTGRAERSSATVGIPMMYYALRVSEGDRPVGYVRVAVSIESIDDEVASVNRRILGISAAVAVLALLIAVTFVARIVRPLGELTTAAQGIAEGDFRQTVDVDSGDELGTLAGAFNTMAEQLAQRIDQLKQEHAENEKSRKLLETVFGTMTEGVVVVDNRQRMLLANPAAHQLLDLMESRVNGRLIWEVIRSPAVVEAVKEAVEGEPGHPVELKLPRTNSVAILTVSNLPGEPPPGTVLVFHDVTELRRLENLRRDFVSNVSHELKTPLTSIQAYSETLLDGALDDPGHSREFVQRIAEGAERLHSLIQDLLALARIESAEAVLEKKPVAIDQVVEDCLREHAGVAVSKSVELLTEIEEQGLCIQADENGLRAILDNLVDNAIHYTPEGGTISLSVQRKGDAVCLSVSDTGIGIPREHLDRIFERFYRVDKARSREHGGTGLGLSIVKHLVGEFGGSVRVESRPGQGSTFRVEFPLTSAKPAGVSANAAGQS